MRANHGFTLIEVLVAMLVLALAMTAWQLRISSQLDNAGYLRDKTLASWVAYNELQYLHLA
ncbi:MAG: type II secretion system minor pseudopilin GspI, partial [Pseudomonadota bacterium]